MYRNTDQTGIASGAVTVVALDTVAYDPNGNFNASTHRYTAPVDGYYSFKGAIHFNSLVDDAAAAYSELHRNGTLVKRGTQIQFDTSADNPGVSIVGDLRLVAGDFIDLIVRHVSTGASQSLLGGAPYTYLDIHWIGPS